MVDHIYQKHRPNTSTDVLGLKAYLKQILCAEGHQDTRDFLVIWLGLAGYRMISGNTIVECVEMAASRRFHLFLIGDRFPDGSGLDLAEAIRSFDPQTPLVLYSSRAFQKDIERGMKAGAQAYITKPSDPELLLETIRLLINTDDREGRSFKANAIGE